MVMVLMVVHIMVALSLIGVVLIQRGQGADMGVSFGGGGAQTLFGSRGSGSFLGKVTGGLAATFMITSLALSIYSQQSTGSVLERAAAPVTQQKSEAPAAGGQGVDPAKLKSEPAPAGQPALPGANGATAPAQGTSAK